MGKSLASIINSNPHVFIQRLGEHSYLSISSHQSSPLIFYHCTRGQYYPQIQCPLRTSLALNFILVMPTICILAGYTGFGPYESNGTFLAVIEREKARPHLTTKGFTCTVRLPSIL